MNTISPRMNGQTFYTPQKHASASREEMLDDLLSMMRERQLPDMPGGQAASAAAIPGKGTYIDLYV